MREIRKPLLAFAAGVACVAIAACSSSSSSTSAAAPASSAPSSAAASTSASPAPATTAATTTETPTQKEIAANWTLFFNPAEPASKRVALLENGQQIASAVSAQATSSTAKESSAKVVSVTVLSTTQAKVVYDILLGGTPALTNQPGTAVYQDGTWKVSLASFCALLTLQSAGSTSSLPAACKS
jgi:hypothetical protein